ncbi:MAG TPA: metalloregulator ArsR/SmtB family transcription factor [Candidatus Woesebacteria bacterium]|nr:metalloregulator ArsR/SmtB family transcription factor [Candidatus Woesebacteria bacterium]HRT40134.1 metalloregulator ArsR/SmtB family transcription factor [Candidatus Woesebacteria bacterium]
MDKIFKALVATSRRKILTLLRDKEMSVTEIVNSLNLSQATISNHLAVLKKAGLVILRSENKSHYYSLNREIFNKISRELSQFADYGIGEIARRKSESKGLDL